MAVAHLLGAILLMKCAFSSMISLDTTKKFNISWASSEDNITFVVQAATVGWVGLGLSPNGAMAGSDLIIAWVTSDGAAHLEDRYAERNGLPTKDASQDVQLIYAHEANGVTTVSFSRKLNTCDEKDLPIKSDTIHLVYAYGSKDPVNNLLQSFDYHGSEHRGSKSVYLLEKVPESRSLNATSYDFATQVALPNASTTYYCSFHQAPDIKTKHHVIAYEAIIQKGNEDIVHHILLYACYGVTKQMVENSTKRDGTCYTAEMPKYMPKCQSVIVGWAVGGNIVYLPDHVGLPIGDEEAPEYYMLETHYNNPNQMSGRKDASKIRLYYTPALRKYDMGTLNTGSVAGIFAPPKTNAFNVHGYCSSDCINDWIPKQGIKILGFILHAHLLGREIKVHWYRNNTELRSFASDQHYDFNYQNHHTLSEEITLLPGDALKVTCTLNSTARSTVTYGGLSTTHEMCVAFLDYYPRQNISRCSSMPSWALDANNALWSRFGTQAKSPDGMIYEGYLDNVTWTDEKRRLAALTYNETPHINMCDLSGRINHQSNFKPYVMPPTRPYEEPKDQVCRKDDDWNGNHRLTTIPNRFFRLITRKAKGLSSFFKKFEAH